MIYFITYDLHQAGRDYSAIERLLKTAPSWAHPMGSVWFIDSTATASEWRDALRRTGDSNDEYFVARIANQNWSSWNLDTAAVTWLKDPARRW